MPDTSSLFNFKRQPPRNPDNLPDQQQNAPGASRSNAMVQGPQDIGRNPEAAADFAGDVLNLREDPKGTYGDISAAIGPTVSDPNVMLRQFKANHTWVPVQQLPTTCRGLICDGVNAATIRVPDGAIALFVGASKAGNIYMSMRRLPVFPAVAVGINAWANPTNPIQQGGDDTLVNPSGWYFCYGVNEINIIGDNNAIVGLQFYLQDENAPPFVTPSDVQPIVNLPSTRPRGGLDN
jgi:hypothetical protein